MVIAIIVLPPAVNLSIMKGEMYMENISINSVNNIQKDIERRNVDSMTIRLSSKEKQIIRDKAVKSRKSTNRFIVDTLLASEDEQAHNAFELGRKLAQISRAADQILSDVDRQIAKEKVTKLWQNLR